MNIHVLKKAYQIVVQNLLGLKVFKIPLFLTKKYVGP